MPGVRDTVVNKTQDSMFSLEVLTKESRHPGPVTRGRPTSTLQASSIHLHKRTLQYTGSPVATNVPFQWEMLIMRCKWGVVYVLGGKGSRRNLWTFLSSLL